MKVIKIYTLCLVWEEEDDVILEYEISKVSQETYDRLTKMFGPPKGKRCIVKQIVEW